MSESRAALMASSYKAHLLLNVISTEHSVNHLNILGFFKLFYVLFFAAHQASSAVSLCRNSTSMWWIKLTLNKNLNHRCSSIKNIHLRIILSQILWLILFRKSDIFEKGAWRPLTKRQIFEWVKIIIHFTYSWSEETWEEARKKKAKTKDTEWKEKIPKKGGEIFQGLLSHKRGCADTALLSFSASVYFWLLMSIKMSKDSSY